MSVADHLNIRLDEYDALIGTFVPDYGEMLSVAATAIAKLTAVDPVIVDLGIGTGALAARCMECLGRGRLVGIDADAAMLDVARRRFSAQPFEVTLRHGSFLDVPIPACDAVIASLSLHHVESLERKALLYAQIGESLREDGLFITADCFPSEDPALGSDEMSLWRRHLQLTYSADEADNYLNAWAKEDHYVPLEKELTMIQAAGMVPDVAWRRAPMGVIVARRAGLSSGHKNR